MIRSCGWMSAVNVAKLAVEPEYGWTLTGRSGARYDRVTDRPTSCRRLQRQLIRLVDRRTVEGSQSTTLSESLKLVDVLVAAVVCAVSLVAMRARRTASAGQTLRVLVGEDRAIRLVDRVGRQVLRRDELEAARSARVSSAPTDPLNCRQVSFEMRSAI